MDVVAHFVFGLWLSRKVSPVAVPFSVILDIDHVLGFLYDKIRKKNIKTPTLIHLAYRPRSWLHSLLGILIIGLPFYPFFGFFPVFIPLLTHLLIDMLDNSGVMLLFPFSFKHIHGILPASYLPEEARKRKKTSHIPSVILIIASAILIFLKV
jgi:membrane-bound metal-dependent hydrolase YbcI (DUF457 family)